MEKQSRLNIIMLTSRENEDRRSLQMQEDQTFMSFCFSLNTIRRSDVDLQLMKTSNKHTEDYLAGARSREQEAQEATRRVEKEKEALRDEVRSWKQEVDSLNRKLYSMENRINELEEDSKNQKVEFDARLQRSEFRVSGLKEERDMLMSERTKLLAEKEQLLEVHSYSAELEIMIHKGKENSQLLQHEITLKDQEIEVSKKEGQKWKQQLTEYEDSEAERNALYNKTVQSLRQEIFCLEERVRAAESDSENKLQTDMLAMIAMQNEAVERDAVLLKMKEETALLQSKNDAFSREKAVLMEKLVAERAKNDVLNGRPVAITASTTSQLVSCSTQTDSSSLSVANTTDDRLHQMVSSTDPLLLMPTDTSFDPPESIEDMKQLITSSAAEVTAAKQLISQKEEATEKLRQKMHERLYHEMQSLHSKTTTKEDDAVLEFQKYHTQESKEHIQEEGIQITQSSHCVSTTSKREQVISPHWASDDREVGATHWESDNSIASTRRVSPPRRGVGRNSISSSSNSIYYAARDHQSAHSEIKKELTELEADSTIPIAGGVNHSLRGGGASDRSRSLMSPRNDKYQYASETGGEVIFENRVRDPLGADTHALTSSAFPSASEVLPTDNIWQTNTSTPATQPQPQPPISTTGTTQAVTPSVAEQYRKTEDDLCALRQRVVDLRGLQRQAQIASEEEAKEKELERERGREKTLSPQVVELVSHPIRTPILSDSPRERSAASTVIAMECIPPNHDPRLPSVSQQRSEVRSDPIALLASHNSSLGGSREIMRRLLSNACRDNEL
eukprot:TRINITY_DN16546_c0_g1_i2.p1 TRINITY_DN16546_c0_g1~~TRINITY_DN16546_c0_g1_i2.p1  ORF type:complete len:905 (+),score=216.87 TRINITY_DN16546_c0_g1_i2:347-2716(+)